MSNDPNNAQQQSNNPTSIQALVQGSPVFKRLRSQLLVTAKMSVTGITNFVVHHENPALVDFFLTYCFPKKSVYNQTIHLDAVELQDGAVGSGNSTKKIDQMIYGTYSMSEDPDTGETIFDYDPRTGKRLRNNDGFVSRLEVRNNEAEDKTLIIRNVDFCADFCPINPGNVENSLWVFDKFRDHNIRRSCRLVLVTNVRLQLPFHVRVLEIPKVNNFSARHLIDSYRQLYVKNHYQVGFTDNQINQMSQKLMGVTYSEAADTFLHAMSNSKDNQPGQKAIKTRKVVRLLREKINQNLMQDGTGLTHLIARPWEDYICPESSNFTFDVKKILRDLEEIKNLMEEQERLEEEGEDASEIENVISSIQSRVPHVIVLYGKGGVGKSAFPIHLAGLLDYDVWDFNINATHSKWVGEGAQKMREAISKIEKASHLVVRIDEYDRAIGSTTRAGQGMHEAHKQVESEIMNWLQNCQEDSVFTKQNIFIVMTTNHKENITGPLLRSGRADLVIDIGDFDSQSIKETFLTSARRMSHRGIKVPGFVNEDDLQTAIDGLDLDHISEIAMVKGFTVRDVETLLMEMGAHKYYYDKGEEGLPWDTETFVKVMEHSQGSTRSNYTGELVLGDRYVLTHEDEKEDEQVTVSEDALCDPDSKDIMHGFEET